MDFISKKPPEVIGKFILLWLFPSKYLPSKVTDVYFYSLGYNLDSLKALY